jgi:NhaP-type Na+/H+ or K+/H+ antiporter
VSESTFFQASLAVALGLAAHTVAERLFLPSIVVLLATGVLAGPEVLGLFDPGALGGARDDLVKLAVTVILFEGGLGLRIEDLRHHQQSLVRLLTIGAVISMAAATTAARLLLQMPWSTAFLYGALMIVTGPTVVTPLLARLAVDRRIRELLIGEGVLIDPIGAIVAIVTLEYVAGHEGAWRVGWLVVVRLSTGAIVGAAAGLVLTSVLKRQWVRRELWNPVVLGAALLTAATASRLSAEAGLMTAVVQGIVMGNKRLRELHGLRKFNEEITLLLLTFAFVLLAADLPLEEVFALGWNALAVVAVLVWVARPLAVFLCTAGAAMSVRERAFVSWICPRGIVAASVAGLFRILLDEAGIPGGNQLEALVFVTVAATVTVQGLTAGIVARWLGVDVPRLCGTLIIGADRLGRLLSRLLIASERPVMLLDRSPQVCREAEAENLPVYRGDALSVEALEEAGAPYADTVLAATENVELNALVAEHVRQNFRVQRILSVGDESTRSLRAGDEYPLPGNFPGVHELNRSLYSGAVQVVGYEVTNEGAAGRQLNELPYGPGEFALLLRRRDWAFVASADQRLEIGDRLLCAAPSAQPRGLAELLGRMVRGPVLASELGTPRQPTSPESGT